MFVGVSGHEILLAVAVFCLGSAECRWDRGEWRRMDFIPIGGKEIESGFVLSLYLRNDEWTRTIIEGNASWFQRLLGKDDIKGSYRDSTQRS